MFKTVRSKLLIWSIIVGLILMACDGATAVATLAPQDQPAPVNNEQSTGTPDLSKAVYVNVKGTQVPTLDLTAQPVPEPPEYSFVMILPADVGEIEDIHKNVSSEISRNGFGPELLASLLPALLFSIEGAPNQQIDCDKVAEKLTKHLLDTSEKNRMFRLAGKNDFWLHLTTLISSMEKGNIVPLGYVVAQSMKKLGLLFRWDDPIRGQIRNILIIFTAEAWTSPTIIPLGEVKSYGPLAESMVDWLLKLVDYEAGTGFAAGYIYLAEEAMRMVKGLLPTGAFRMTAAIQEEFASLARTIGSCIRRAVEKQPEYQEWKAKQPNGNNAPAEITLGFQSQEEALQAAVVLTEIGITAIVVKLIISAGTGQWYLMLAPVP